jgi:Mlc titration factor MtfA (ptsG expression regulator)
MYSIHNILASRYSYYKNLSNSGKEKFLLRVKEFIETKDIEGRNGLEVTQTMEVLIAASGIQLTFGLDNYLLQHFKKIIIYPDKFYSPYSKTHNVGEVNTGGVIVLSWKAFEEGIANQRDSYNVALHEMAHALNLTDFLGKDVDPLFSAYFDKWYVHARKLMRKLPGEDTFFRKYASKNIQEFFAVGVEHFFEQPEEFQNAYPEFYKQFTYLLNQDPLQKDSGVVGYTNKKEKVRKIEKEKPVLSLNPAKATSTVFFEVIVPVLFLIAIVPFWNSFGYFSLLFGGVAFFQTFMRLRKKVFIEVFNNRFSIIYPHRYFNKEKVFFTDDMISVNFLRAERKSVIQVVSYTGGSIEKDSFSVYSDFESFQVFFKHLFNECSVAIKNNGEIVVPE